MTLQNHGSVSAVNVTTQCTIQRSAHCTRCNPCQPTGDVRDIKSVIRMAVADTVRMTASKNQRKVRSRSEKFENHKEYE
eukprot:3727672-Amphidinium_carterae.1